MDEEKKNCNHITYLYLIVTPEGTIYSMTNESRPYDWSPALKEGHKIVGVHRIDWGKYDEPTK